MDQRMRANPWGVTPGADANICVSRTNPFLCCCWVFGAVFCFVLFCFFAFKDCVFYYIKIDCTCIWGEKVLYISARHCSFYHV